MRTSTYAPRWNSCGSSTARCSRCVSRTMQARMTQRGPASAWRRSRRGSRARSARLTTWSLRSFATASTGSTRCFAARARSSDGWRRWASFTSWPGVPFTRSAGWRGERRSIPPRSWPTRAKRPPPPVGPRALRGGTRDDAADALAWRTELARVAAPPRGRLMDLVLRAPCPGARHDGQRSAAPRLRPAAALAASLAARTARRKWASKLPGSLGPRTGRAAGVAFASLVAAGLAAPSDDGSLAVDSALFSAFFSGPFLDDEYRSEYQPPPLRMKLVPR